MSQAILQEAAPASLKVPPRLPVDPPPPPPADAGARLPEGWSEETLIDDEGSEIKLRYLGKASLDRYKFIRDYLDFKIARAKKGAKVVQAIPDDEDISDLTGEKPAR